MKRIVPILLLLLFFYTHNVLAQCSASGAFVGSTTLVSGQGNGTPGNPYRPGSVVRVTATISGTYNKVGNNWWHGIQINLGSNFTFATPLNFVRTGFPGNDSRWIWRTSLTGNGPGTAGPGIYYDSDNDGNPADNNGHSTSTLSGTFSFNIVVGNNASTNATITANILPDGFSGSWSSSSCDADVNVASAKTIFNNVALPATLISFRATKTNDKDIELVWQTATEQNVSHFEIQYSTNGRDWSVIGTQQAVGNSTLLQTYRYLHTQAISADNLYRIRMVDRDNREEYSRVVSIKKEFQAAYTFQKPYPNPVKDKVGFRLIAPEQGQGELSVYNTSGNLVARLQVEVEKGLNEYAMNASQWPSGIYLVRFNNASAVVTEKFLKQ